MTKTRDCPICGGPIMFIYMTPNINFYIENEKIEQDKNDELWHGKDPYIHFQCSNDAIHDLHAESPITEHKHAQMDWEEKISKEFYEKIFPHL